MDNLSGDASCWRCLFVAIAAVVFYTAFLDLVGFCRCPRVSLKTRLAANPGIDQGVKI